MNKKVIYIAGVIIILILVSYWSWRIWPQDPIVEREDNLSVEIMRVDSTICSQVLLGVQTEMEAIDYSSEEAYYNRINNHLISIKAEIFQSKERIMVFPEHIGTWLVAANERNSIYKSPSVLNAMATLVMSNPINYKLYRFTHLEAKDDNQAAVFLMKSQEMARIYNSTFSKLAKEYSATIIAGSIVLPSPSVVDGKINVGFGKLYNVSFLFDKNGRVDNNITYKSFPIEDEQAFCEAGKIEDWRHYDLKENRLGTLICADSWYAESYNQLSTNNVNIIAVPSYSIGNNLMSQPWKGYNGFPTPPDVDHADIGKLTESEAWDKYALSGKMKESGAAIGINVYLRGILWDMISDGKSKIVKNHIDYKVKTDGAALILGCLPEKD